jgi:hypothetical protein
VRGQGGRAAAVGECGFNGFRYEVKKEGEEGESVGHCFMMGNRGGMDGASLPLPWSTGGHPIAACSAAASARPKVARATEVGEDPRVGRCWAERLLWLGPTLGNSKEKSRRAAKAIGPN